MGSNRVAAKFGDRMLRVLVRAESDGEAIWYVAQCVEFDLATQGRTVSEVLKSFASLVEAREAGARRRGLNDPFEGVPAAPLRYRDIFERTGTVKLEQTLEPDSRIGAHFEARVA